jgi:hypothetical protein
VITPHLCIIVVYDKLFYAWASPEAGPIDPCIINDRPILPNWPVFRPSVGRPRTLAMQAPISVPRSGTPAVFPWKSQRSRGANAKTAGKTTSVFRP